MTTIGSCVDYLNRQQSDNAALMAACLQREAEDQEMCYVEEFIAYCDKQGRHNIAETYRRVLADMVG